MMSAPSSSINSKTAPCLDKTLSSMHAHRVNMDGKVMRTATKEVEREGEVCLVRFSSLVKSLSKL